MLKKNYKQKIKHELKFLLRKSGIHVLSESQYTCLEQSGLKMVLDRWCQESVPSGLRSYVLLNFQRSHSQLQQDLVAEYVSREEVASPKYFVEFGATDGMALSNSFALEKGGWKGVLVEPDGNWHAQLSRNRNSIIDFRCVYSTSGTEVDFIQSSTKELSGIEKHAAHDGWSMVRREGLTSKVETVTLKDLLIDHGAPPRINFLSIDTEGSEFEIIKDFDFEKWRFDFIAIEHNFGENERLIQELLESKGYFRVLPKISAWDGWYVNCDLKRKYFDNPA